PRDEPPLARLAGVERAAAQQQIAGPGDADLLREDLAVVRVGDAAVDLGRTERRAIAGDRNVGQHRDHHRVAEADAGPRAYAGLRLAIDGPVAVITNDQPDKHNAFDDAMDQRLFEILGELKGREDIRAIIWQAEGKSFSSGRDVAAIGGGAVELTHHELMAR